ncbi:MAG: hypothetical protein K8T91_28095 [Planctomycetes bacterium]|nr:hypothetical protein [Planctomycetota bacterium]
MVIEFGNPWKFVDADLKVIFFGRFESAVFFVSPRSKMDHFLSSLQGQSAAWSMMKFDLPVVMG